MDKAEPPAGPAAGPLFGGRAEWLLQALLAGVGWLAVVAPAVVVSAGGGNSVGSGGGASPSGGPAAHPMPPWPPESAPFAWIWLASWLAGLLLIGWAARPRAPAGSPAGVAGTLVLAAGWGVGAALVPADAALVPAHAVALPLIAAGLCGGGAVLAAARFLPRTPLVAVAVAAALWPPALAALQRGGVWHQVAAGELALSVLIVWLASAVARACTVAARLPRGTAGRVESLAAEVRLLRAERDTLRRSLNDSAHRLVDRTRFVAAASHDLRQPIHALGLFVEALRREPLSARARYLVDRMDRSMHGLDELFARLLDISRLDAGSVEVRRSSFALGALFATLHERFGSLAEQRGLRLSARCTPADWVFSDPVLLAEVLMNVVSNALRHTHEGRVLLTGRRRAGRVLIQVWDTGPGIPANQLGRIFEEFVQLDNPSHDRRRGLGLGLSIVRRLGDLLGSPVGVRSWPGSGTVFELAVPLAAEPRPAVAASAAPVADLQGMLMLVVDDDIEILAAMEAVLSAAGCFVLLARSVGEAERRIADSIRFPDVVITDHELGGGEFGADVLRLAARALPLPFGAIVVSAQPPELAHELPPGTAYLRKPVRADELLATVRASVPVSTTSAG